MRFPPFLAPSASTRSASCSGDGVGTPASLKRVQPRLSDCRCVGILGSEAREHRADIVRRNWSVLYARRSPATSICNYFLHFNIFVPAGTHTHNAAQHARTCSCAYDLYKARCVCVLEKSLFNTANPQRARFSLTRARTPNTIAKRPNIIMYICARVCVSGFITTAT